MTVNRVLVANRGEIARRVFATCRRLGIETVAVHSDADADLPFVREADVAVQMPGNAPAETYLRGDLVIEAARRAGADAIHPGYGFLSENADFARAVIGAGLTWVGPAPESIEQMGSKVEAKKLMDAAGVPILPDLSVDDTAETDLPVLVKASAGGGGRGMRVVRTLDALAGAVAAASAEASSAFGDPTVFVEPFVEHGRHVEVQVVGDQHGEILVLGERDCSIQRRHQKVIEESPAPAIAAEVVAAMHRAAHDAAAAIAYVGAGTVEFLYDPGRERFYFLEMNTRLQVEHPVTEAVHGLDLVALQIAVAEGRRVTATTRDDASWAAQPRGHAIEVRLYAEDPDHDWQPQSGRLTTFDMPGVFAEFDRTASFGLRLDSGFESGSEVSTYYDAMLAKVIAWAPTRADAARLLAGSLRPARIHGVRTNRDQLVAVLTDRKFLVGEVSTDFLVRRRTAGSGAAETPRETPEPAIFGAGVAAAIALAEYDVASRGVQRGIPVAWRNVVSQPQRTVLESGGVQHVVEWWGGRDGYLVDDAIVLEASPSLVRLEIDGVAAGYRVTQNPAADGLPGGRSIDVDGPDGHVVFRKVPRFTDPTAQLARGSMLAPMPGTVVKVGVEPGRQVAAGDTVLVLEAMKMQHTVAAPHAGTVTDIPVEAGQQVAAGEVLAVVDENEPREGAAP